MEGRIMSRFLTACLICLIAVARGPADEIEDGIYALKKEGEGRHIKLNGGAEVVLGPRLGGAWAGAAVRSTANDNSRFLILLSDVRPLDTTGGTGRIALLIDGVCLPSFGQSHYPDGKLDLSFTVSGDEAARKVAARLKVEPQRRKHPGHRVEVRWVPDKEAYRVGEPITLTMELKNVGDAPIAFQNGGKQRGPRNNQFRFLAYRLYGSGKAVADTGDPNHMGGIGSVLTYKPGETFSDTVRLDKWFQFTEPDTYRVTGLFELELHATSGRNGLRDVPIWDAFAVGDCLIKVVAKEK
jgi:hypothetical protein